ncbi:MAG: DsrE family protein [Candidatus Wallbacteria bacterium]|nr:DsrE family protein [Candidatus Wallbacteria bacterium]
MSFLRLEQLPGDDTFLKKCLDSGIYQGFVVTDQRSARTLELRLSGLGFTTVIRERERGFYVKINSSLDRDLWLPEENLQNEAYLFKTPYIGDTPEALGDTLLCSFFFDLLASFLKPQYLIFISGAVKLVTEGSPILQMLQELESEGLKILCCRTSLEAYDLTKRIRTGKIVNMADIIQVFNQVKRVISL